MNYYILLTAPLVWLIIAGLAIAIGSASKIEEAWTWALVITIAIYLALFGIVLGVR